MAVKKITKNKVIPTLPKNKPELMDYEDLEEGSYFLMDGTLWIKYDMEGDQIGNCLITGRTLFALCGCMVEPVNIEIHWSKTNGK